MLKIMLLVPLLYITNVQSFSNYSENFFDCINPDISIDSSSECTSIDIESDGYKCCSLEIIYGNNNSLSCFALENEYTKNKTIFDEYMLNRSLISLFGTKQGEIKIDCGEELVTIQKKEEMSDEYNNCYNNHINGVDSVNDCHKYEIPEKERSKCCYMETQQKDEEGKLINEKRCYIIQEKYFTPNYNLNNYLLDKTNKESLDQIKNINITINCKNYDVFTFKSKSDDNQNSDIVSSTDINKSDNNSNSNDSLPINKYNSKKDSGINTGAIIGIVIAGAVVLIGAVFMTIYCVRKGKTKIEENYSMNEINKNNINNNNPN